MEKPGMVMYDCNPSILEAEQENCKYKASPGHTTRPHLKNNEQIIKIIINKKSMLKKTWKSISFYSDTFISIHSMKLTDNE